MKTKLLVVAAALVGAATLSAQAGIFVSFRLPFPPFPVPVIAVTPPAPVVVVPPAPVCTPVTIVTPACPGPDYVWVPGYWSGYGPTRVWVSGCWQYTPTHFVYDRDYARYGHYEHFDGHDGHFYGGHRR